MIAARRCMNSCSALGLLGRWMSLQKAGGEYICEKYASIGEK